MKPAAEWPRQMKAAYLPAVMDARKFYGLWPILFALIAALSALAGCGNTSGKPLPAEAPPDYSLTLYTATPGALKFTWFELTKTGELRYAGGLDASNRQGKPVAVLTPQQRQAAWDIIVRGKLGEAGAGPLFPKADDVSYDFTLNTGGPDRIVRAADDEQPALRELHDFLFNVQKAQYAK
jgi:hypothetical protein